jgi:hypothetical protein
MYLDIALTHGNPYHERQAITWRITTAEPFFSRIA